jgi:hypothetical protein
MPTPIWSVDFRDVSNAVIDLTPYIAPLNERGIVGLTRRLSYLSRETDFGRVSLLCFNGEGAFSEAHENFILGAGAYHGRRVRIRFGWLTDLGERLDPDNIFVGFLEDIIVDTRAKTAELKLTDVMDRLKLTGPPAGVADDLLADASPAANCLLMLGAAYANIPDEFVDIESFTDADTVESGAGVLMRNFRIQRGSWMDSLKINLTHGGTGIRVDRHGRLTYFSYAPDTADGDPHFAFPNVARIRGGRTMQTVRNATTVFNGDGMDPPQAVTSGTDLTDVQSIASFGLRPRERDRELIYFDDLAVAELTAERDLDIEAKAPGKHTATIPFDPDSYLVDLAQRVKVTSADMGWAAKNVTVDGVSIDFGAMALDLGVIDTDLDGDTYLYVNRAGHALDDGKLIY